MTIATLFCTNKRSNPNARPVVSGQLVESCMLSPWGAERAFLLRRQLSKLHRPAQFAALVAGTGLNIVVTDAARMLAASKKPPHELSALLMAEAVLPDTALGVGTSKRLRAHQKPEYHCEALLCTRPRVRSKRARWLGLRPTGSACFQLALRRLLATGRGSLKLL